MIYKLTNYNPDPVSLPDGKILRQGESDFIVIFNEISYMVHHELPVPNDPVLIAQASLLRALLPLINSNQVVTEIVTAGLNEQTWGYYNWEGLFMVANTPVKVTMPLNGRIAGLSFVVEVQATTDAFLKATRDGGTIAVLPISKTLGAGSVVKMPVPVTQSPLLKIGEKYDLELVEQGATPAQEILNTGAIVTAYIVYNQQAAHLEYAVAQVFSVAHDTCVSYVEYKMYRAYASNNAFVWVELWGVEPGTYDLIDHPIAVSNKFFGLSFPGDNIDMVCHFEFPVSPINKNAPYALVLRASNGTGPGQYFGLRATGNLYPDGILVKYQLLNDVLTITPFPTTDAWFKIGTGGWPLTPSISGNPFVRHVAE